MRPPKLLDADALYAYAGRSLASRAQTVSELRDKLKRRAAQLSDVDDVLARLKESGYLNDQRFAESFAGWRRENQGIGKARVMRDLMSRRVAPSLAIKAADAAYEGVDEIVLIENFLARKYRGRNLAQFLSEEKNLASAYRKLRTSGFGGGNSIRVLKRYASQAEQLEESDGQTANES